MHTEAEHKCPVVSVIMPSYNARDYIDDAIRSVLAQTVTDWELFVIDDGSGDGTYERAVALAGDDPRIRVLKNEQNMGVSATRNRGISLSRGRYIALLDCDDIWYPEKLERQLARMEETGAAFCYCAYAIVGADGKTVRSYYPVPETVDYASLLGENVMLCSSVLLSAELAKQYPFNTDYYHEDYLLWLQLLSNGFKAVGCTETLVSWRFIENSRSFNKFNSAKNRWKIYRDYLKLPLGKTLRVFARYTTAGVRKYFRKER